MLCLTCVHASGFDGTLDYMSPSLDDGFHMATHIIEALVLWRTLRGYLNTWRKPSHHLIEVVPHFWEDVEPFDDMAPLLRHPRTYGVRCDPLIMGHCTFDDDLTPLDGNLHLSLEGMLHILMMIWHLLMRGHMVHLLGMICHLEMKHCTYWRQHFTFWTLYTSFGVIHPLYEFIYATCVTSSMHLWWTIWHLSFFTSSWRHRWGY